MGIFFSRRLTQALQGKEQALFQKGGFAHWDYCSLTDPGCMIAPDGNLYTAPIYPTGRGKFYTDTSTDCDGQPYLVTEAGRTSGGTNVQTLDVTYGLDGNGLQGKAVDVWFLLKLPATNDAEAVQLWFCTYADNSHASFTGNIQGTFGVRNNTWTWVKVTYTVPANGRYVDTQMRASLNQTFMGALNKTSYAGFVIQAAGDATPTVLENIDTLGAEDPIRPRYQHRRSRHNK